MSNIERYDIGEEWAHSGIIKAGNFIVGVTAREISGN